MLSEVAVTDDALVSSLLMGVTAGVLVSSEMVADADVFSEAADGAVKLDEVAEDSVAPDFAWLVVVLAVVMLV